MNELIYGVTNVVTGEVSSFVRFRSDDEAVRFIEAVTQSICFDSDRSHLIPRDELKSLFRDAAIMRFGEFGIVGDSNFPTLIPCHPYIVAEIIPLAVRYWDSVAASGFPVVSRETSERGDSDEN